LPDTDVYSDVMELSARFLYWMRVPEGRSARIAFCEANGDEYVVDCFVVGESVHVSGDSQEVNYLKERYSPRTLDQVARPILRDYA